LAGLDTAVEIAYFYDNHNGTQLIELIVGGGASVLDKIGSIARE